MPGLPRMPCSADSGACLSTPTEAPPGALWSILSSESAALLLRLMILCLCRAQGAQWPCHGRCLDCRADAEGVRVDQAVQPQRCDCCRAGVPLASQGPHCCYPSGRRASAGMSSFADCALWLWCRLLVLPGVPFELHPLHAARCILSSYSYAFDAVCCLHVELCLAASKLSRCDKAVNSLQLLPAMFVMPLDYAREHLKRRLTVCHYLAVYLWRPQ